MKLKISSTTPKDKASMQEILRQGQATEFWQLLKQALQESIESLQEQADDEEMRELSPEQYKLENELIKAKKQYLNKLLELPDTLISWFQDPESENPNFDPYETASEQ